jgi:hypothetical protein
VESDPQDQRLTRDHPHQANHQRPTESDSTYDVEDTKEIKQLEQKSANCRRYQTVKIGSGILLEVHQDRDKKLRAVEEGNASKANKQEDLSQRL